MIGPLAAMAASNFAGAGLRAPAGSRAARTDRDRHRARPVFHAVVAERSSHYWPLLLVGGRVRHLSRRARRLGPRAVLTGIDATTAFFASVPGGAAEMTILGERFRRAADRVALAQSLRILAVVIVVPFALTYSGAHGTDLYQPAAVAVRLGQRLAATARGCCRHGRIGGALRHAQCVYVRTARRCDRR